MTAPLISVCIANYNGVEMIEACIESVLSQGLGDVVEIIVHDDASTDDSVHLIRQRYPAAKLIASIENVGFCIANNRMAAAAAGQYLLLLNNDATLLPDALESLITAARDIGSPAILTLPQYDADTGALLDIGCGLDIFLNPIPNRNPTRSHVATVHGACLWIDRALWDQLGGFPDWFGSVAEDLYLCCRARLGNYPVKALDKSGYSHRVGTSFGGGKVRDGKLVTTFRRRALSECNKTFVIVMTYPTPIMQVFLPIHLFLLLLEGGMLSLIRMNASYLQKIYFPVFRALYYKRAVLLSSRRMIMQDHRLGSAGFFKIFDWFPHKFRMLLQYGFPRLD